jgi:putative addiction module component (TIGR02574 family)
MDYHTVLGAVESWPVEDRIRLVHDVWDQLVDQGYEPELTEEMKAELDRRIAELERNPELGVPWEEAKARVLGRLQQ